jgi:hypothetical protein
MKQFNVTLERKTDSKYHGPEPLRTSIVVGTTKAMPEVGRVFEILAKPFVPDAIARLVTTSYVTKIWKSKIGICFETETGSIYELTYTELN